MSLSTTSESEECDATGRFAIRRWTARNPRNSIVVSKMMRSTKASITSQLEGDTFNRSSTSTKVSSLPLDMRSLQQMPCRQIIEKCLNVSSYLRQRNLLE